MELTPNFIQATTIFFIAPALATLSTLLAVKSNSTCTESIGLLLSEVNILSKIIFSKLAQCERARESAGKAW